MSVDGYEYVIKMLDKISSQLEENNIKTEKLYNKMFIDNGDKSVLTRLNEHAEYINSHEKETKVSLIWIKASIAISIISALFLISAIGFTDFSKILSESISVL